MSFSIVHSCYHAEEANFSLRLRMTGVALGVIIATIGVLVLTRVPQISQLGTTAGWSMLATGLFLTFLGSVIKCVQMERSKPIDTESGPDKSLRRIKPLPKAMGKVEPTVSTVRSGEVIAFTQVPDFVAYSYNTLLKKCITVTNLVTQEEILYTGFKEIFFYKDKFIALNSEDEWEIHSLVQKERLHSFNNTIFRPEEKIIKVIILDTIVYFLYQEPKEPSPLLKLTCYSLTNSKILKRISLVQFDTGQCDMQYENETVLIGLSQGSKLTTWQIDQTMIGV